MHLLRQPSAPLLGQPHVVRPGQPNIAVNRDPKQKYVEEQYSKYVKDIGQLLEGNEEAQNPSDQLVALCKKNENQQRAHTQPDDEDEQSPPSGGINNDNITIEE